MRTGQPYFGEEGGHPGQQKFTFSVYDNTAFPCGIGEGAEQIPGTHPAFPQLVGGGGGAEQIGGTWPVEDRAAFVQLGEGDRANTRYSLHGGWGSFPSCVCMP